MLTHKELVQTPEYWVEIIQNRLFREVQHYLDQKQLTQTQLAEQLGVSKGYISQILHGNFNHTLKKLVEISLAVGVVPDIHFKNTQRFVAQSTRKTFHKEMSSSTNTDYMRVEFMPSSNIISLESYVISQTFSIVK